MHRPTPTAACMFRDLPQRCWPGASSAGCGHGGGCHRAAVRGRALWGFQFVNQAFFPSPIHADVLRRPVGDRRAPTSARTRDDPCSRSTSFVREQDGRGSPPPSWGRRHCASPWCTTPRSHQARRTRRSSCSVPSHTRPDARACLGRGRGVHGRTSCRTPSRSTKLAAHRPGSRRQDRGAVQRARSRGAARTGRVKAKAILHADPDGEGRARRLAPAGQAHTCPGLQRAGRPASSGSRAGDVANALRACLRGPHRRAPSVTNGAPAHHRPGARGRARRCHASSRTSRSTARPCRAPGAHQLRWCPASRRCSRTPIERAFDRQLSIVASCQPHGRAGDAACSTACGRRSRRSSCRLATS